MGQHVVNKNSEQGAKKPRRKSGHSSRFLQKAKKFGQQGKLGHGFEVDSDTYSYFLRVLELFRKNEFESDEEKGAFIRNSLEQAKGSEVNLSKNQMVSRVLESILPAADDDDLFSFCEAFSTSLRIICADPYASHVLEKLLEVISISKTEEPKLTLWFQNTAKFILNNYAEFAFDKYANCVMRKTLQCLSGMVEPSPNGQKKSAKLLTTREKVEIQKKLKKENVVIFKQFYNQFLNWHQFNDLLQDVSTSALVQVFTHTLQPIDENLSYQVAVQTLKAIPAEFELDNSTTIFTIENCIQISSDVLYEFILNKFFKTRVAELAVHQKGQHTLRKLITFCPSKEIFEEIFDAVEPKFQEIMKLEFTNLFVACAETCKRLATRQSEFVKGIKEVLGKEETADETFVELIAKFNRPFTPREDGTGSTFLLDLNGCLVLQHMLEFHKPSKVVKSLLEVDTARLVKLAQDPKGSHIFDSYFKSTTLGEKNKEKLLLKFKEDLVNLACSKFGSRVLDSIWAWASIKQKAVIADALSQKASKVSGNEYGKFQAEKIALHAYKRDPKKWEEFQQSAGKRKAELEDFTAAIITSQNGQGPAEEEQDPEGETPRKKKKKSKKNKEEEAPVEEELVDVKVEEEPEVEAEPRRKKKKKKAHAETNGNGTLEQEEEQQAEEEEEPPKKKKKKRKHQDE